MGDEIVQNPVDVIVRPGRLTDVPALVQLHQDVAEEPGALIRQHAEITPAYMSAVFKCCEERGLMLVVEQGKQLIGEIHAYAPDLFAFSHVLSELTIVIHPQHQGKGIGRMLFEIYLKKIKEGFSHILRVELYTREHNTRNVSFYTSLGFRNEGRQEHKIKLGKNRFHTPIHMVWFNPNYQAK